MYYNSLIIDYNKTRAEFIDECLQFKLHHIRETHQFILQDCLYIPKCNLALVENIVAYIEQKKTFLLYELLTVESVKIIFFDFNYYQSFRNVETPSQLFFENLIRLLYIEIHETLYLFTGQLIRNDDIYDELLTESFSSVVNSLIDFIITKAEIISGAYGKFLILSDNTNELQSSLFNQLINFTLSNYKTIGFDKVFDLGIKINTLLALSSKFIFLKKYETDLRHLRIKIDQELQIETSIYNKLKPVILEALISHISKQIVLPQNNDIKNLIKGKVELINKPLRLKKADPFYFSLIVMQEKGIFKKDDLLKLFDQGIIRTKERKILDRIDLQNAYSRFSILKTKRNLSKYENIEQQINSILKT